MLPPLVGSLLLAASVLPSVSLSQTINVDGKVITADQSNIVPASGNGGFANNSGGVAQLTEAYLANLTDLELSNISLFSFDSPVEEKRSLGGGCKVFPGDRFYPTDAVWKVLNLLSGGALSKTVPIGAICYTNNEHYDKGKCQNLLNLWNNSDTHVADPTSVMSPLLEGATCMPQDGSSGKTCDLGGFPPYYLKITSVAQVQLAINFARNLNLRLVVRNTGHDFLGKNTGAGALSLWTRPLRDIKVFDNYESPGGSYRGPAFKIGAGVNVKELYEAADSAGYTAVGGECRTVGVSGGYIAGGGHSPLSPIAGLGSDQVLSVEIVTPDGRFVTADENNNQDLFWAVRGGGGSTWGVVTSMTVKVYPRMKFSGMTWNIDTKALNVTDDLFWKAWEVYFRRFPEYADAKSYGYCFLVPAPTGGYTWTANPWMIPGMALDDFKKLVAPLLKDWSDMGFPLKPTFFEHDSFLPAWHSHFPKENVGMDNVRTGSRFFPRKNWDTKESQDETFRVIRSVVEDGSVLIHYNMHVATPDEVDTTSVNPAWRDTILFAIVGTTWPEHSNSTVVDNGSHWVTYDALGRLKNITVGGGGYMNEGDVMDPEFQQTFFGDHYPRLLDIKKKIDPKDVFWAPTAVGSENWYITDQLPYLTTQNGKLCRK